MNNDSNVLLGIFKLMWKSIEMSLYSSFLSQVILLLVFTPELIWLIIMCVGNVVILLGTAVYHKYKSNGLDVKISSNFLIGIIFYIIIFLILTVPNKEINEWSSSIIPNYLEYVPNNEGVTEDEIMRYCLALDNPARYNLLSDYVIKSVECKYDTLLENCSEDKAKEIREQRQIEENEALTLDTYASKVGVIYGFLIYGISLAYFGLISFLNPKVIYERSFKIKEKVEVS